MRWKSRSIAFTLCFAVGFALASIALIKRSRTVVSPCASADYFNSPEEVLAALKSPEVTVRRNVLNRLLLRPDIRTVYYDYERDLNYPERTDRARLEYVQLDDTPPTEAVLTFVRLEHPAAFIFSKESCGWKLVAVLSSWLRFEDYPYNNWLTLPTTIEPGIHELLVRDSNGDAMSYFRKARLLRLDRGHLTQVAEFDEETLEPVKEYAGSDWNDVKQKQSSNITFSTETIQIETTTSLIKLRGSIPTYGYWLETDGIWHTKKSNWSARSSQTLKVLNVTKEPWQVWNATEGRFVGK